MVLAARPDDLPLLHGVPCTIKESFSVTGMPWSAGLVSRRDVRAGSDAVTVQRLRAAGAIVLGVTNTSELCMWMESNNRVYGRTNNPWDLSRTCGGSSGGGAAVAAGAGARLVDGALQIDVVKIDDSRFCHAIKLKDVAKIVNKSQHLPDDWMLQGDPHQTVIAYRDSPDIAVGEIVVDLYNRSVSNFVL